MTRRLCDRCGAAAEHDESVCISCGGQIVTYDRPGQASVATIAHPPATSAQRVAVIDIDMPFGSMVGFMVKWTIASIPAILILIVLGFVLSALFAGFIAAL